MTARFFEITMPRHSNRIHKLFLGMLCAVLTSNSHLEPLTSVAVEDGRDRLDSLLNERLDFIRNQGGPYVDPDKGLRWISSIFTSPYCPHCPVEQPITDEEETKRANAIRMEAEKGEADAQFQLAGRYLEGKGVARDVNQGLRWLEAAAANGVGKATFALAEIYDLGIYVPVDQQKAAHLYEIALSERAYPDFSRRRLGEMNEFGIGIPQNFAKAMELYQPEIAPRDRPPFPLRSSHRAEFAIGRLYAQGKGVPQDYAKAAEWFLIAVDRGTGYGGATPEAECALAIMYWTGLGVPRDQERGDFFLHRPNTMGMKACQTLK
ncbi:sel1 repeat family protein [Duganella sp. BJB488]|uniref:tetratricopeptide repeat protein n=1 Tax=unclassified Duganella TaxID=2636909 RepID=UPI000E34A0A7|nr:MULTISPECIES: tetratricopeptide repeat protein [unclassified Duganella]NVD72785.1 sel1 repeat family protein [Duganella sp. BJB1802]RFP11630.1 sel1 repeat family protein [Duganella sp. BJB489]RFP15656.1 sel1 repeat family protein [Duganella sp. BJB488]RFP30602.1 sel1 repeat family protein [Duganella sp. BJB480]